MVGTILFAVTNLKQKFNISHILKVKVYNNIVFLILEPHFLSIHYFLGEIYAKVLR